MTLPHTITVCIPPSAHLLLEQLHQARLVRRLHAPHDPQVVQQRLLLDGRQLVKLEPHDGLPRAGQHRQPDLVAHRLCGGQVVAREHDHPDASLVADLQGVRHLAPGGVVDAHHPQQRQAGLVGEGRGGGACGEGAAGEGQATQRLAAAPLLHLMRLTVSCTHTKYMCHEHAIMTRPYRETYGLLSFLGHGRGVARVVAQDGGAACQHLLRRPLGQQQRPVARPLLPLVDGAHHLAVARKLQHAQPRVLGGPVVGAQADALLLGQHRHATVAHAGHANLVCL